MVLKVLGIALLVSSYQFYIMLFYVLIKISCYYFKVVSTIKPYQSIASQ
jgi:hypothetical protein